MNDVYWAVYLPVFLQMMESLRAGPVEDAARNGISIQKTGNVAIIPIKGGIVKNRHWRLTSAREGQAAVNAAKVDPDIEKILLWFDTPGGSVDGIGEFGEAIKAAAKEKEVIAQVDGMCASAGLWLASHVAPGVIRE